MDVLLAFVMGLLLATLACVVLLVVLRARRRSAAVDDALVPEETTAAEAALEELAHTTLEQALEGEASVAERLTRVDELRARDLIDADEHAEAREQILREHDEGLR